ncbi:hypothetical protein [Dictyobacter formicarum]|uniref:Zinc-ribbon domain-containing protein n=1 Tax=Dictyobacter formicarum TaxID=2778368 RepID=A0ABQ3VNM4_9CHLR|nr:hypothetical protein [Dictyobacter formicarum]GHO87276.1 hypothetical protein KSZ_52820 [Dictyobacter formicarum]
MAHCQFCGAPLQPSLPYCQSCGTPLAPGNAQSEQAFNNAGNAPQQPPNVMPMTAMPQGNQFSAPAQPLQPKTPSTLFKKPGLAISQPSSSAQNGPSLSRQPSQSGLLGNKSLRGIQPQPAGFPTQQPQLSPWPDMQPQNATMPAQQQTAQPWGAPAAASAPFPMQPPPSTPNNLPPVSSMPGTPFTALPNTPQPQAAEAASLWQPPQQPATEAHDGAQAPVRRKGRAVIGVWLTIFILCMVVVTVVGVFAYQKYSGGPAQQASSFVPVQGPSGTFSVEQASTIILHAQTSSHIDINYNPVDPGKSFAAGQKIYISFDIQTKTKTGYIEIKWYSGKHMKDADTFAHDPTNSSGYFSTRYDGPTQGAAELYWCTRANCSDAQLAQVVTFTVTP